MFTISKAQRGQVSLKIGMVGPSGSGKTMSSLKFAKGLVGSWNKICLIDTENSGHLYSHLGDYLVLVLAPPFTLERYIGALKEIEKQCPEVECVIIDSISHGWDAEGGHQDKVLKMGGRFQDHAKAKPDIRRFLTALQQSTFHVICTGRTDTEWAVEKDERGKNTPIKVGTKIVFAPRFEYELTLVFRIEHNHCALADKDRTDLFNNMLPVLIDETIGEKVREWNKSGVVKLYDFQDLVTVFGTMSEELQAKVKTEYGELLAKAKDKEHPMDEKELHSLVVKLKGVVKEEEK